MATLAIRGHETRGKEVIEILEMLGGKNRYHFKGDEDKWFVLDGSIKRSDILFDEKGFTLEDFLEKFPYKVGDKALLNGIVKTIKQARWDSIDNEVIYKIETNIRGFSEEYCVHYYDLQPYKRFMFDTKDGDYVKIFIEPYEV